MKTKKLADFQISVSVSLNGLDIVMDSLFRKYNKRRSFLPKHSRPSLIIALFTLILNPWITKKFLL